MGNWRSEREEGDGGNYVNKVLKYEILEKCKVDNNNKVVKTT